MNGFFIQPTIYYNYELQVFFIKWQWTVSNIGSIILSVHSVVTLILNQTDFGDTNGSWFIYLINILYNIITILLTVTYLRTVHYLFLCSLIVVDSRWTNKYLGDNNNDSNEIIINGNYINNNKVLFIHKNRLKFPE